MHKLRRNEEAVAMFERSLAIVISQVGPEHAEVATYLLRLYFPVYAVDPPRARALVERALAIQTAIARDHPDTARILTTLANDALASGDQRRAHQLMDDAITMLERIEAKTVDIYMPLLLERGRIRLRLGRHREAVTDLKAAREAALARGARDEAADAGTTLAEALWALGTPASHGEARDAARGALEIYEADGKTEKATTVRTWLAAHGDK
jgi:tetratricopeptide (TPR) repeat protein